MEAIVTIITGSVIAIISIWFGKWISRNSAKEAIDLSFKKTEELINRQEFLKSATQFQCAFTKEIRLLRTGLHNNKAQNIINAAAIKHENAMIRFRHYIIENKLASFDTDWAEYKNHTYNSRHSNRDVDIREEKSQKELAENNIEELLKFTK